MCGVKGRKHQGKETGYCRESVSKDRERGWKGRKTDKKKEEGASMLCEGQRVHLGSNTEECISPECVQRAERACCIEPPESWEHHC